MKARQLLTTFSLATSLFLGGIAVAQSDFALSTSTMKIHGTSSLHEWDSEVTDMTCQGSLMLNRTGSVEVKRIDVRIPVKSIKSEHGSMMDNKTYDAFKSEKYPDITFKAENIVLAPNTATRVEGQLSMAGVSRLVVMSVTASVKSDGSIRFSGVQKINMTDYKMETPTALMGTIKVGEEVSVTFDITWLQKPFQ